MSQMLSAVGTWRLSNYSKSLVAKSMYAKGRSFVEAAYLLHKNGGYEFVVLHRLCQGIEVVLKAVLLAIDYDRYRPQLKDVNGHNLVKAADIVLVAAGLSPMERSAWS
ncbi:MAG TPA: hypothetical protein VFO44_15135 [Steroidobacteraceae bacterium]|nr:hypothetical protein [Steroidobacteraceae bacterium]